MGIASLTDQAIEPAYRPSLRSDAVAFKLPCAAVWANGNGRARAALIGVRLGHPRFLGHVN